ncbi:MAG: hypothetical protein ACI906_004864 [Candidatus Latescibacterota bacterium]|jgi:hypothetical protein
MISHKLAHLLLVPLLFLFGCTAAQMQQANEHVDGLPSFASRTDHLQRLEPRGEHILFGSGVDFDPYANRNSLQRTRPAYYTVAYDLSTLPYDWHLPLRDLLAGHEDYMLLQIDISMVYDGRPYVEAVADGQLDEAIDRLCFGLRQLNRPTFVRFGYEFNSTWNKYDPELYRRAWQRFGQTLRNRWDLERVALVWTAAADGHGPYMDYYPGDEYVDWWSIEVYTPADLRQPRTRGFIRRAAEHGYPILLGASTPMSKTPKDSEELWQQWFERLFGFLRSQANIKAFSYRDWTQLSHEAESVLSERFRLELSDPTYQHAAPLDELRWFLEWD